MKQFKCHIKFDSVESIKDENLLSLPSSIRLPKDELKKCRHWIECIKIYKYLLNMRK